MLNFIQLIGIRKSYPDGENRLNHVLQGIDLEIGKGEFLAIQGPSGSGKTTLLSVLGTLLLPDSGAYLLAGKDMTSAGVDLPSVRNRQIGFVFQEPRLMPQLTVLENILLPVLACRSDAGTEKTDDARRLLELTRIPHVAHQYPPTLSGGEASRAAVCRALIMNPPLLLADEPTGRLDADNARNIAALLADVNKTLNTTIVMVTHSGKTSAAAHRLLTLEQGRLA